MSSAEAAERVQATVGSVVQCVHMAWPEGSAPDLPWAVWYVDEERGFCSDDSKGPRETWWCVELYERSCDYDLHDELESAIEDAYGPCKKTESWLSDEDAVATVFTFKEIG